MSTTGADVTTLLGQWIADRRLELPVLPMVATQVLSLSQNEAADPAKLSAVIHRDQALAAHVLRVANSAAYAGGVACGSLPQAVSRLGMQSIRDIAVAVAVKGAVFASDGCAELFAQLWRHSVMTAFFGKEIARIRQRNVEVAFLCGLLHDIGQAVLLANVDRRVTGRVAMDDLGAALQRHHTQVGVELARGWRLPEPIVECIACHHDYTQAVSHRDAVMTVCLADRVAHLVAPGLSSEPTSIEVLRQHPVLRGLGLDPDQLQELLQKTDAAHQLAEGMA